MVIETVKLWIDKLLLPGYTSYLSYSNEHYITIYETRSPKTAGGYICTIWFENGELNENEIELDLCDPMFFDKLKLFLVSMDVI